SVGYLQQMYAAGLHKSFDAISVHPYTFWPGATAEEMLNSPESGWQQLATTTPSIRSVMIANGDATKRIWVTEFGAPTNQVSELQQADLLTAAVANWRTKRWA